MSGAMRASGSIVDVPGIEVGNAQDLQALTGCTAVLCRQGAVAGGAVRGLAPGTRETDLLRPGRLVEKVHAVLLTGGSAFGLAAADGVMRYLEEEGVGFEAGGVRVPIVPAAVIFDLDIGDASVRPGVEMGYQACRAASAEDFPQGNVGAGTGATVGKLMGTGRAMKSGLGTASLRAGRLVVAALMVVNPFGDVVDPSDGRILAGTRRRGGRGLINTAEAMRRFTVRNVMARRSTVIGVVATNAGLDVARANVMAEAAHDGLARAVRPSHTLYDGDAIFALSLGGLQAHPALVGDMAAEATALAIVDGALSAESAGGLPAASDMVDV